MRQIVSSRGQSLVEFALVAPVLFLLIMGILDGGRVFAAWVVMTNEAREGARYAVVDTTRDVNAYVRSRTNGVLDPANLTVTTTVTDGTPDTVQVTINYRMSLVTPLIGRLFANPLALRADSIMRAE